MSELTHRQCVALEVVLIAVGLLACLLFWWHDGNLSTPSYILFMMMVTIGFIGFALRFCRRSCYHSGWGGVAFIAVIPMLFGFAGVIDNMQRNMWASATPAYLVLAAYGLVTVGTEMSRRAEKKSHPGNAVR